MKKLRINENVQKASSNTHKNETANVCKQIKTTQRELFGNVKGAFSPADIESSASSKRLLERPWLLAWWHRHAMATIRNSNMAAPVPASISSVSCLRLLLRAASAAAACSQGSAEGAPPCSWGTLSSTCAALRVSMISTSLRSTRGGCRSSPDLDTSSTCEHHTNIHFCKFAS